jgi:hypothetical protein
LRPAATLGHMSTRLASSLRSRAGLVTEVKHVTYETGTEWPGYNALGDRESREDWTRQGVYFMVNVKALYKTC